MLRFRVLGASFSRFWGLGFRDRVLRFRSRGLRFRVLGASFSRFGCFVLRSSFSSASFSKLPAVKSLLQTHQIYDPCKEDDRSGRSLMICYAN